MKQNRVDEVDPVHAKLLELHRGLVEVFRLGGVISKDPWYVSCFFYGIG
jgi:hypothetical protein